MDDIEEFDAGISAELGHMLRSKNPEEFEAAFGRFFTTQLSDSTTVELEADGAQRPLTYENRHEYARKALYRRMSECEQQCDAIKRGICNAEQDAMNLNRHDELPMSHGDQESDDY